MNELHLFAGAGGGILGGMLLGHTTVCAVEIEPYCRRVLLQRQRDNILPKFPIWDDVCTFDGNPWRGKVDVVCGGFPCQDISAAGGGAGIKGERSGLWGEMARIIGEICPRFVFIENSPVLRTRGLHIVLKNLAEMGYNARWGIIGARSMGGPIKRDRMWVLAYPSSNQKSFLNTESDLFDKEFIKNKLWSFETFSTLLECDKKRMPIISRDERVVNGMAHSVDRLAAIGNGQVPIVAATAFRLLSASVNK